jgi:hypothetical protein
MANHVARCHILDSNHTKQDVKEYLKGVKCNAMVENYCFELSKNVSIANCREYIDKQYEVFGNIDISEIKRYYSNIFVTFGRKVKEWCKNQQSRKKDPNYSNQRGNSF